MSTTFSFGVSSNLLQQKSTTAEIIGIYFLGTIVLRKYIPIISAVGLFCYDKFEESPNEKGVNVSKLTKPYFKHLFYMNKLLYSARKKWNLVNICNLYIVFVGFSKIQTWRSDGAFKGFNDTSVIYVHTLICYLI